MGCLGGFFRVFWVGFLMTTLAEGAACGGPRQAWGAAGRPGGAAGDPQQGQRAQEAGPARQAQLADGPAGGNEGCSSGNRRN